MTQGRFDVYAFVGTRIREERKARHMTLEELASAAGMNPSFLYYIEKNKKRPSLGMVQRIADGLGVSLGQLFNKAPIHQPPELQFARKLSQMVREAGPKRRRTILRIVKSLSKDE